MNYENATDFELEVKLANILGLRWHCQPGKSPTGFWIYSDNYTYCRDGRVCEALPDYCTDWNATMPLAVEHGLDIELPIECLGGIGQITKYIAGDTDIMVEFVIGDNPLRAIVICLIKVLEAKQ